MSPRRHIDRLADMRDALADIRRLTEMEGRARIGPPLGQRNVVVHEYHRLDVETLWTTAKHDVPRLDQLLAAVEAADRSA